MPQFEIQSVSDGLLLQGHHWPVDSPLAAVSLVHGFGEHCGRYEKLAAYLNANRIAVVGVDLRGHGRTDSPRGVVKTYADLHGDLKTLLKQTTDFYPAAPHFLFGHSMGGGLVLHHGRTTDDEIDGYLVSAPLLRLQRPVPAIAKLAVKALRPIFARGTLPVAVSGKKISTIPDEQDLYDNDPLNHCRLGFGLALDMIQAGENTVANAAKWHKPLRLWHSQADCITDFEATREFADQAQNCQFTAFEVVQHEMHQDVTRAEVHCLMSEFILGRL